MTGGLVVQGSGPLHTLNTCPQMAYKPFPKIKNAKMKRLQGRRLHSSATGRGVKMNES